MITPSARQTVQLTTWTPARAGLITILTISAIVTDASASDCKDAEEIAAQAVSNAEAAADIAEEARAQREEMRRQRDTYRAQRDDARGERDTLAGQLFVFTPRLDACEARALDLERLNAQLEADNAKLKRQRWTWLGAGALAGVAATVTFVLVVR